MAIEINGEIISDKVIVGMLTKLISHGVVESSEKIIEKCQTGCIIDYLLDEYSEHMHPFIIGDLKNKKEVLNGALKNMGDSRDANHDWGLNTTGNDGILILINFVNDMCDF